MRVRSLLLATTALTLPQLCPAPAGAACSPPYNFQSHTTAFADQVQANFTALADCINAPAATTSAPHLPTDAALAAASTAVYPNGVWRDDFAAAGAPPLFFAALHGSCAANGLVNDGGSCRNSTDGNSWKGQLPAWPDARQWGDDPTGNHDSSAAIQAAMNFVAGSCGTVLLAPGWHLANTLSQPSCVHLGGTPGALSAAGTVLVLNANNTYLIADAAWVNNLTVGNNGGGLRDLILEGGFTCNQAPFCGPYKTATTGTIAVHIKDCFACLEENLTIQDSDGFGEIHAAVTANGTLNTGGEGGNVWRNVTIQANVKGGEFGLDNSAQILADMRWDMMQFANNATDAGNVTASQTGTTLAVTALNGALYVGETVSDNGVHVPAGEYITACPAGGCTVTGNYTVSQSASISSEAMVANGYAGSCTSMRIDNGTPGNAGNILTTSGCTGVQGLGQIVSMSGLSNPTEEIIASLGGGRYVVNAAQNLSARAGSMAKTAAQFDHDRATGLNWGGGMSNFFYSRVPMNGNLALRNASQIQIGGRFDSGSTIGPGAVPDISVLTASGGGNYSDGIIAGEFFNGAAGLPGGMTQLQMVLIDQLNSTGRQISVQGSFIAPLLIPAQVTTVVTNFNCCTKLLDSAYSGGAVAPYPTNLMDVWGRLPDWNIAAGLADDSGDGLTFGANSLCGADGLGSVVHMMCHLEWPGTGSPTHNVKIKMPVQGRVANNLGWASAAPALPESGSVTYLAQALFSSADAILATTANGAVANSTINSLATPKVDFAMDIPVR